MSFFQICKAIAGHSSLLVINKDKLNNWLKQQVRESRLSKLDEEKKTAHLLAREILLVFQQDQDNENIHTLITRLDIKNTTLMNLLVPELASFLGSQLQHEAHPLAVLSTLIHEYDHPIYLAAFLLCLLRKNIPINTILESGLLHQIFSMHCQELSTVQSLYHLLSLQSIHNETSLLLDKARQTSPNVRGVESHDITGNMSQQNLSLTKVQTPSFQFSPAKQNRDNLYALFGHAFLAQLLYTQHCPKLDQWLAAQLAQMSYHELAGLYQYIETTMQDQLRHDLTQKLAFCLTDEKQLNLLTSKQVSAYMILANNTDLLVHFDDRQLQEFIQAEPLHTKYIFHAATLCTHVAMRFLREPIFSRLFNYLLDNPALIHTDENDLVQDCLESLRHHETTKQWCDDETNQLMLRLHDCIQQNTNPLDKYRYYNILDLYETLRPRVVLLNQLTGERSILPTTRYELQAMILKAGFDQNENNICRFIDIINSDFANNTAYTTDQVHDGKIRMLIESLCFINDTAYQDQVILILADYQVNNWKEQHDIDKKALLNNNTSLLQRHFSNRISSELLLYMIDNRHDTTSTAISNAFLSLYPEESERIEKAKTFLSEHPVIILELLKTISLEQSCECLLMNTQNGNTLLHHVFESEYIDMPCLLAILQTQSRERAIAALTRVNNSDKTPLLTALRSENTLQQIHAVYPEAIASMFTHLHDALRFPDSLAFLLSVIPETGRINTMMSLFSIPYSPKPYEPDKIRLFFDILTAAECQSLLEIRPNASLRTIFHETASILPSLKLCLKRIGKEKACSLLMQDQDVDGNTPLHTVIHNETTVRLILSVFPNDQVRLDFIKKTNKRGENALLLAEKYPASLQPLLNICTRCNDFTAIFAPDWSGVSLMHVAASKPEIIKMILLSQTEEEQRLRWVKQLYPVNGTHYNLAQLTLHPSLFHRVRWSFATTTDISALETLLQLLPIHERLRVLLDDPIEIDLINALFDIPNRPAIQRLLNILDESQHFDFLKKFIDCWNETYLLKSILYKKIDSIEQTAFSNKRRKTTIIEFFAPDPVATIKQELNNANTLDKYKAIVNQLSQIENTTTDSLKTAITGKFI